MENLDKILKLVEAGYSKEEISAMLQPEIREEPEEIKEEPVPEQKEEISVKDDYISAMKEVTDELKKIKEDLRRNNILTDSTPISDPLEESRKVLASIIDPPAKKGKE